MKGGEAQGEVGIVFEVVANGGSIKDQGVALLINQQLNGVPEVGGANYPHVAALGQLHATAAVACRRPDQAAHHQQNADQHQHVDLTVIHRLEPGFWGWLLNQLMAEVVVSATRRQMLRLMPLS